VYLSHTECHLKMLSDCLHSTDYTALYPRRSYSSSDCLDKTYEQTDIVGFEVFTVVVTKSIIFWDMTPCSLLSFNRSFGGTYRLHLQVEEISSEKKQQTSRWQAETSVKTQRTARRHILEDDTLQTDITSK
jgi:hypothetical protein